jgi:hypothetical protein
VNPTLTVTRPTGYTKVYPLALDYDRAYEWAVGYAYGEYSLWGGSWSDAHTPRTDAPVRFLPLHIGPYRSSVERPA